jgi:cytochrome c oxidase subunit 2
MPLSTPEQWWKPFDREERIWLWVISIWGLIMFLMMPLGHLWNQNVSSETYRTSPDEFRAVANAFIQKYQRVDEQGNPVTINGIPVVDAPEGDVFLMAQAWVFRPILVFQKGKTYRIHLSSMDFQHGFSLQPQNLNFQILPGYDFVVTMTPQETGTFHLVCNEYCFYASPAVGHDTMVGRIIVEG